jgi:type II restriction enzyme
LLATAAGLQPVGVWLRTGAFPTKILDGGRSANLKLEQTGARFATPMAAKVNALTTPNTVRDRMLLVEEMGSTLRYANVADKVFRANCAMIDLHLGRLLTEMVRLSYMEEVYRLDELAQRMNELNPLKVKSELIEKHGFYEYKLKQLLMACAAGMRPAKIYTGIEDLPPYRLILNPDGRPVAFPGGERARLADFLFHHTRLERGSMEKDKYGELERENNVYYFKLNLKIALAKR